MSEVLESPAKTSSNPGLTPKMLNHAAWVTHDVAATYDFYTRIMGMELASTVIDDRIPSTGDGFPYFHAFFKMKDGSTFAFFEAPGLPPPSKSTHPAYDIFNHVALEASSPEEVMKWYDWFKLNGLDVVGPTDHGGVILSIYLHDPNGLRLEIAAPLDKNWNNNSAGAKEDLERWVEVKEKAKREGRDIVQAMQALTTEMRGRNGGDWRPNH